MACQVLSLNEMYFQQKLLGSTCSDGKKGAISIKIIIRTFLRCTRGSDSHKFDWLPVVRVVNGAREVQVIIIAYTTSTSLNYRM